MKDKIISKIKQIKIEHVFLIFILIQPFLDIYTNYVKHPFELLGLSMNVLINFVFIFGIIFYYIRLLFINRHQNKCKKIIKKDLIISIIYILIFVIYVMLHCFNMQLFDDGIFNRNAYGFIKETYFIFRCFVLPIVLLYTLYRLNISKKTIITAIKLSVFIICFIVIVTNVFCISLASYAEHGKFTYIDGNIFHWLFFTGKDNFDLYTSKGWFHSANELSAILFSLSPLIIYLAFVCDKENKKEKVFNCILLVMLIITMNMLGTRVASWGMLISLVVTFLIILFFKLIKKLDINLKKVILKFIIFMSICIILFIISPFYANQYGKYKSVFKERPVKETIDIKKHSNKDFAKYMETHYWYFFIDKPLLDIYPVKNDVEFWEYLITRDLRLNCNYRDLKTDIYERILARNDNKFDKWVGIGYNDLLTNERDYSIQIYHFGIVGLIVLLGPIIFGVLYCGYRIVRYRNKYFKADVLVVFTGNVISVCVPYLTGHVFGVVFPMTYVVLNLLLLLKMVTDDDMKIISKNNQQK